VSGKDESGHVDFEVLEQSALYCGISFHYKRFAWHVGSLLFGFAPSSLHLSESSFHIVFRQRERVS
jgi:hypothetical protein